MRINLPKFVEKVQMNLSQLVDKLQMNLPVSVNKIEMISIRGIQNLKLTGLLCCGSWARRQQCMSEVSWPTYSNNKINYCISIIFLPQSCQSRMMLDSPDGKVSWREREVLPKGKLWFLLLSMTRFLTPKSLICICICNCNWNFNCTWLLGAPEGDLRARQLDYRERKLLPSILVLKFLFA